MGLTKVIENVSNLFRRGNITKIHFLATLLQKSGNPVNCAMLIDSVTFLVPQNMLLEPKIMFIDKGLFIGSESHVPER